MTLWLMAAALLFAVIMALPLGILAAVFHGRAPDFVARFIALVGQSVAAPWLGVMLIFLFAVNLRWLPSSGASRPESVILPGDRGRRLLSRGADAPVAFQPARGHGQRLHPHRQRQRD